MPYDPDRHHRRSMRLRGYDYTQPGSYFVTICTNQRLRLFDDPKLRRIAETHWQALAHHSPHVTLDAWVVMPNHIHGIVVITSAPEGSATTQTGRLGINVAPGSLGAIVRTFKSVATRRLNVVRCTPGSAVWQRGYWESVVRDTDHLAAVRRYIANNPLCWAQDHTTLDTLLSRLNWHHE